LLDASDSTVGGLLSMVRQAWANLRDAEAALEAAQSSTQQGEQLLAAHRQLLADVEGVSPAADEDRLLDARIATVSARDAIERSTRTAAAMLTDGDSLDITDATSLLAQTRRLLEPHAVLPAVERWIARLIEAQEAVSDVAHDITAFADALEGEASSLDELLSRRAQIGALLRRWNCDLPTMLERSDAAAKALAFASDPQQRLGELQSLAQHCAAQLEQACAELHLRRRLVGERLAARVASELRELGLPHADFAIEVVRQHQPAAHGDDVVEFRFSANPGQPVQPLAAVGSGGELSRVMLALETVAAVTQARTFVFDEVDAGVGGRAALEVGRRLAELARAHQVIVVTHLAQVAAFADRHIVVEKAVAAGVTLTTTRTLLDAERPRELTRLLSGVEDSAAAMAHAAELLELADRSRAGRT
jgi:DNA repair protein RecN (Recombination protein N)